MTTPLMEQYNKIKNKHQNEILLFRLGDFYEMFYEDAKVASRILGIALTSRSKGQKRIPMAGVPYHAAQTYINRLLRGGYRVAICEQTQDIEDAVGIVDRAVVRVITPGTLIDEGLLNDKKNNFLAAIYIDTDSAGLSWIDTSTGKFFAQDLPLTVLSDSIARIAPSELLIPQSMTEANSGFVNSIKDLCGMVTPYSEWAFEKENALGALLERFQTDSLAGFGCEDLGLSISSAGAIISYLKETQKIPLKHMTKLEKYLQDGKMFLDKHTQNSMELTTARNGGSEYSLIWVLDKTRTAMGARLLAEWIGSPLNKVNDIKYRQDGVSWFYQDNAPRNEIQELLKDVCDIERITAKIGSARANARDLASLRNSLKLLPKFINKLKETKVQIITDTIDRVADYAELTTYLEKAIVESPPHILTEGGIIKKGFDEELDKLRDISTGGKSSLARFQAEEIKRTNIQSLKVGFNKIFGYYIEITNTHKDKIPSNYIRKQTLKNAERFITAELKDYETQVLNSEERSKEMEYELFCKVRDYVAGYIDGLQKTASAIAELDVLCSLAQVAVENSYSEPVISDSLAIKLKDSRHPVLEKTLSERFIPNDIEIGEGFKVMIITGPNMAGKSTYIRQIALIVLMAQIGSFVPAKKAHIGVVDRIFTRIGSEDRISMGESTFMVEMNQTANILNNATKRSLIVLDEIGRGTSTFDGVSIAWAVAEYIAMNIKARTLFATHYHELTSLADKVAEVGNFRISVKEFGDGIVFLRKIEPGGTDKSYGIHVAHLAGVPREVIERANVILQDLESLTNDTEKKSKIGRDKEGVVLQANLFSTDISKRRHTKLDTILTELAKIDINNVTPIQAHEKLAKIKEKYDHYQ